MKKTASFKNTSEYIGEFPRPAQTALKRVRSAIKKALPGSTEVISYNIPAFKVNGRHGHLLRRTGKSTIRSYPVTKRLIAAFKDRLGRTRSAARAPSGSRCRSRCRPSLIAGIAKFRASEEPSRTPARR